MVEKTTMALPDIRISVRGGRHVPDAETMDDGLRVVSLGRDTQVRSLVLGDLITLSMLSPRLREIEEAAHG